ncbi:MAG: Lrp/AsnC ligand binding domain-containing protein [Armatimonadetes bacterium]|nr:Lrp/AsnC ligand binding domain-containing protein [Armatimonadota bacterium]MCX7968517.1 Lrp/AsnC ligand binding domain-containing protein [Armatimonadota bacterium]MDW8028743.1 Lrp/AsnC ligand binding domain-containing protein [Armatimonadota bacterium]
MAQAYIFIKVGVGKAKAVAEALRQIPEVKSAHIVWGIPDIIAFAEVPDYKTLTELVLGRVQAIEGVEQTDTRLVVEE